MEMIIGQNMIGQKVLLTCENWFYAPDGMQYRGVWGTIHGIKSDADTLGIKTNAHSTNWYVVIGDMIVAGCQVHYAMLAPECAMRSVWHHMYDAANGLVEIKRPCEIYNADQGEVTT